VDELSNREGFCISVNGILASVCKDDIAPIQGIVENEALDKFVRSAALAALVTLFAEGALERETLVDYWRDLSQKLPPEVAQQFKYLPKEKSKTDELLEAQESSLFKLATHHP
jgi:hypothetical protein